MNKIVAAADAAEREYLASVDRLAILMIERLIRAEEAKDERRRQWLINNPNTEETL